MTLDLPVLPVDAVDEPTTARSRAPTAASASSLALAWVSIARPCMALAVLLGARRAPSAAGSSGPRISPVTAAPSTASKPGGVLRPGVPRPSVRPATSPPSNSTRTAAAMLWPHGCPPRGAGAADALAHSDGGVPSRGPGYLTLLIGWFQMPPNRSNEVSNPAVESFADLEQPYPGKRKPVNRGAASRPQRSRDMGRQARLLPHQR